MDLEKFIIERNEVSTQVADSQRRLDSLYYFQAAAVKKNTSQSWSPSNLPFVGFRKYPSAVIDNWANAWKVRRHFEEQTELRKAAGKPTH